MRYWTIGRVGELSTLRKKGKAEYTDGKNIITIDALGYYEYCHSSLVYPKLKPYFYEEEKLFFIVDLENSIAYIADSTQFVEVMTIQWQEKPDADHAQTEYVKVQSEFELIVNPNKKITYDEFVSGDIGAEEFIEKEIGKGIIELRNWFLDLR
jgi:hypothetical protein